MPRAAQASTSMLSSPTPRRPTTRSLGATCEQARVDRRAVAHDQRVGVARAHAQIVAADRRGLVVADVEARGELRDRVGSSMNSQMTIRTVGSTRQLCKPHLRTVRASTTRKTTFSTMRPMTITVKSPANTFGISSWFLFS